MREAQVVCSDGKERNAYVVEVAEVQPSHRGRSSQQTSRVLAALWRCYAACRALAAASGSVPHALGWFDDHPGDEARRARSSAQTPFGTRLVFERPRAVPLRTELARARIQRGTLTAASPLVRHWVREALARAAEIDEMSTHLLAAPFGPANLWVAEHGTALRVGGLLWGPELLEARRADKLRARSRGLLAGFADAAEEMVSLLCGSKFPNAVADTKIYSEADASAGVFVVPGECFDVVLGSPVDPKSSWLYPRLSEHQQQVVRLMDESVEPDTPIESSPASRRSRLRFSAQRPGVVRVAIRCAPIPPGDRILRASTMGVASSSTTLSIRICVTAHGIDGPLRAILRCCRLLECRSTAATADDPEADESMASIAPSELLAHDYFTPLTQNELVEAMSSYERLFLAADTGAAGKTDAANTGLCLRPPAWTETARREAPLE